MIRGTWRWCRTTEKLVTLEEWHRTHRSGTARSKLSAPTIHGDTIEVKSMVDGKIYTSKSALRQSYRDKGYVELGNEELKPTPPPKPDRKAIRTSVGKALSRVGLSPD